MTNQRDKILPLIDETNRDYVDYYINFLAQMKVPNDLGKAMANSGKSWGAGYGQMFGPLMSKLYNTDSAIKNEVHENMSKIGIRTDSIEKYFTEYITEGSHMIWFVMDDIDNDKKEQFVKQSDQLMLDVLKKYLGLEELI